MRRSPNWKPRCAARTDRARPKQGIPNAGDPPVEPRSLRQLRRIAARRCAGAPREPGEQKRET
jgi:hypothetical protein